MNLQNGYKVLYEKIADGNRTFFADKRDGTEAVQIGEALKIGQYKLIYEKDGRIYGSSTGVPADGDHCFADFDMVFKVAEEAPASYTRRASRKTAPVVEEPVVEEVPTSEE